MSTDLQNILSAGFGGVRK